MKKIIFSSLIAVLMLGFCFNNAIAQDEDSKVYSFVSMDNPPTYPGGIAKFYDFLNTNIKYPAEAIEQNVQGNVHLSFIVEKDGSLTDIKIERGLGAGTDQEAIRVLEIGKKWNPGVKDGRPVRVKYNIPVKFAIKGKIPSGKPIENNQNSSVGVIPTIENDTAIYSFVAMKNPPTYPGGVARFYEFLDKNIIYPKLAVDNKIQGNVHLTFTVEKDGSLTNIKTLRKLGYGTDEEAMRVLRLVKRWNPGMQDGKPVRVRYNIPVKFALK